MIRREVEYFFAALRFFTRLPVPAWVGHSQEQLDHAARYFPLVGVVIGTIGAGVTAALGWWLPPSLAILFGMAATLLATGAFHEDGFSDSCDGFGGAIACSGGEPGGAGGGATASEMPTPNAEVAAAASAPTVAPSRPGEGTAPRSGVAWTKAQILTIMKDSRVGSYGAIGIAMMLFAKFTALGEIYAAFGPAKLAGALIAAHALSRFASTTLIHALDYVREDESSKSKPLAKRMGRGELLVAALFGIAPCALAPWPQIVVSLAAVACATVLAARYFVKRIGGYTGDCLGATQQVAELAFYTGLLCVFT